MGGEKLRARVGRAGDGEASSSPSGTRQGWRTIERRGGDPREDMRHVGGGWSTPQREILRWGWGGLDPPARDLALGGGGEVTPQREHAARLLERAGLLHGSATQAHSKFSQSGLLGSPAPPRRGSSRGCWCCRHRCLLSKTAIVLREHGRAPLRKVTREDPFSRLVVLVLDKVLHEPSLRAVLALDRLRCF